MDDGASVTGRQSRSAVALAQALSAFPAWAIAFSLNGFFVYLGVLHLLGVAPRSALTGAYYGALGLLLLAATAACRRELRARFAGRSRWFAAWVVTAAAFAVLFAVNAVFVASGFLAHRLLGQLLLWSLPAALAGLALPRRLIGQLIAGLAALGCALFVIDVIVIVAQSPRGRFTPIPYLDPISAAQICALGGVAAAAARPTSTRLRIAQFAALCTCGAGAVVTGSRGPTLALVVAVVAIIAVRLRPRQTRPLVALVAAALVVGMGAGFAEGVHLKSTRNFTVGVSGGAQSGGENPNVLRDPATAPVSSIHIRLELMRSALSQSPNHLLEGNGVGMLRDETTEAKLIGAAGCCTFPHNETIEALYSFGVPGLVLYLVLLVAAFGAALTRAYHSRGDVPSMFVLGFLIFAFVNSNLSGAIGSDAWLWAAGAMSVALPRRVSD